MNVNSSSLRTCPHCPSSSRTFTPHGLCVHVGRMHKDVPRSAPAGATQSSRSLVQSDTQGALSLDSLANLKRSVRVLRHIPKGARNLAAGKMCDLIDKCIDTNGTAEWFEFLTFAYSALRAPDATGSGNLTTKVKRNIDSAFVECPFSDIGGGGSSRSPSVLKTVESKVYEGDLRGAVRVLMSDDAVAQSSPEVLATLQTKHPAPSRPLSFPPEPDGSTPAYKVREESVAQALNTFNSGSAAGLDGIRPVHLKELTSSSAGDNGRRLLGCLTKLCNFLLEGRLNAEACPYVFGASLCALSKKDGGLRPIAVGSTFRRLTAKLGCAAVREEMAAYLRPCQMGFGTRLGCEAAIHATRAFALDPGKADCVIISST
jgi:hypothetical protein